MVRNSGSFGWIVGCLVAVLVGAPGRAEDKKDGELKALKGTWAAQSLVFDGENVPADVAGKLHLKVEGEKATLVGGLSKLGDNFIATARKDEFKIVLGTKGDLKTIDLKVDKEGGRTIPGIYKLEKGKLTVCLNFKNGDRPTKFESKADTGTGLYEFEQPKNPE